MSANFWRIFTGVMMWLLGYMWMGWLAYRVRRTHDSLDHRKTVANEMLWASISMSVGAVILGSCATGGME